MEVVQAVGLFHSSVIFFMMIFVGNDLQTTSINLLASFPCSKSQTLKLCRRGEPGVSHMNSSKGRKGVRDLNCAWAYPQSLEICDHFLREIWVCGVHWRAQASNQQIFSQQNRIFH